MSESITRNETPQLEAQSDIQDAFIPGEPQKVCGHPKCTNAVPPTATYKNGACSSLCSKRLSDLTYRRKTREAPQQGARSSPRMKISAKPTIPIHKPIPVRPRSMYHSFLGFQRAPTYQPHVAMRPNLDAFLMQQQVPSHMSQMFHCPNLPFPTPHAFGSVGYVAPY
ncbi:hypothetical protein P9112_004884 [Eukaryota sp. TZLM1-RC]